MDPLDHSSESAASSNGRQGGTHRSAGMTGMRLLNRIDGQRAQGIDAELVELRRGNLSLKLI